MRSLLVNEDAFVANWAYKTYNLYPLPVNKAIGIIDNNIILGACLFQNFNGINIELSYYGPRTLTLGIFRYLAKIAVYEFKVGRLTVVTSQRNTHLIKSLMKIGFKFEGTQRCFYGYKDNKRNTGVRLVAFKHQIEQVANYGQK